MYNVFIAVFGGLYYGIKIGKDRLATRKAAAEREARKTAIQLWIDSITDDETESRLRAYISDPKNCFSIREETGGFYDAVLDGRDFEQMYPRCRWQKGKRFTKEYMMEVTRDNTHNALRIMMAKRGLLTRTDAIDGAWLSLSFYTEFHRDLFLQCVEELRRHGLQEEFITPNGLRGYGWRI